MTPREKWDAGLRLAKSELDELLAEGRIAGELLTHLSAVPLPADALANALGRQYAVILEILRHLASEPVWLAREIPGEGWVLQHGEEPPPPSRSSPGCS
jgi:hypothetical protein